MSRIYKCYGLSERNITRAFQALFGRHVDIQWKVYSSHPEQHIAVNVSPIDERVRADALEKAERAIWDEIGAYIIAVDQETLESTVGEMLNHKGLTLAVAESCTGGLIGNRLTNIPGSSGYFLGGVIAYSNEVKKNLLGVSEKTLQQYGAVSDQTAREMAQGVQRQFQSRMALSVTGIAGPDGGSDEKPVGTVCVGMVTEDFIYARKYHFQGSREQIKVESSEMALDWVRRYLNNDPFLPGL
ncbi:MAG: nicotinamide-nucleotide amidohydrolase family protein [Deltaproteobacteria bacterium]|nr:nicotinamide-nucleotide amidohydrolase family protein [Deltaproteobacteria bacterium]